MCQHIVIKSMCLKNCQPRDFWVCFLLILHILCDSSEEVGKLLTVPVRDGALSAVADDQSPVVFGDSRYWLHSVGTSRA